VDLPRLFHFLGDNEDDTFAETQDHSCCRQHRHYSARLVIRISSFLTSRLPCAVRIFFFLLITSTYPYISSSHTHQHDFFNANSADTRQLVSLNLIICCCCYYHSLSHISLNSDLIVVVGNEYSVDTQHDCWLQSIGEIRQTTMRRQDQ
jgi:hypothetical protein